MAIDVWPLVDDVRLREEAAAVLRTGDKDESAVAALRETVRATVLNRLDAAGAARFKLIAEPEAHPVEKLTALLTTISGFLGALVPQTRSNELVARIQDQGADYQSPHTRGHQTNAELAFHSDRCDLNALLYVRTAAEGGELSIVSYEDAGDSLEQQDEPSYQELFREFPFDARDDRIFEDIPWYTRPILWRTGTSLRGHYIRRFITESQRHSDCPRLSPAQERALDNFDAAIEAVRPPRTYRPVAGELLVMDSYRVMHARRSFVNSGAGPGRLAIRTWVAPFRSETLPASLLPLAGSVAANSYRGGAGSGPVYHSVLGLPVSDAAPQWG